MSSLRIAAILLFLVAHSAHASIIWVESTPTGNLPSTAQDVIGSGTVDAILGNLSDLTEVDMYRFLITDPLNFSAQTVDDGFSVADPQLFLFNGLGFGVYSNDDGFGIGSQSFLEPGHPLGPVSPGLYYLAIGWWNNEPFSSSGPVFEDGTGINGLDLVGGLNPVIGWNGDVSGRIDLPTQYTILLTGVEAVPEPATVWLLSLALAFGAWRCHRRGAGGNIVETLPILPLARRQHVN